MSKGLGQKMVIKFDQPLVGDVTGITPTPVGGQQYLLEVPKSGLTYSASNATYGVVTNCFDLSISTLWGANNVASWVRVDFGSGKKKILNKTRWYTTTSYAPRAYVIEGSNDGVTWDVLASGESANSNGWKEHEFENTIAYRFYQFRTTTGWSSRIYIYEFEYYEFKSYGNEVAFIIQGEEPAYILAPEEEAGPLIQKSYIVDSVQQHPTEENSLLLTMAPTGLFRNVEGDLTVIYDMTKGTLAGSGGAVASFEEIFTPEDLEEMRSRWWRPEVAEKIALGITPLVLSYNPILHTTVGEGPYPNAGLPNEANYQSVQRRWGDSNNEHLSLEISLTITLINIEDINP